MFGWVWRSHLYLYDAVPAKGRGDVCAVLVYERELIPEFACCIDASQSSRSIFAHEVFRHVGLIDPSAQPWLSLPHPELLPYLSPSKSPNPAARRGVFQRVFDNGAVRLGAL